MSVSKPLVKFDAQTKGIFMFAFWALLEAVQLIVVVALIFSFIPMKVHPFAAKLFVMHQKGVQPEREMFLYRLFAVAAIFLYGAAMFAFRRKMETPAFNASLRNLTGLCAFWLFVQIFAVFKLFVTGHPPWAQYLLYFGIAGAVISRVFWAEIQEWTPRVYAWAVGIYQREWMKRGPDIGFSIFVVLLIYVPDLTKALARIFVRDQFYHLDSFIMAPGWASLNGMVLNKDVISEYSVVIPWIISRMAKITGGFDYQHVLGILIVIAIAYYIGFYFLIKQWLRSRLIAVFAVLLFIKLQMFHWGVAPLIWQFPSATVIRYVFDLPVLWLLWRHCVTGDQRLLWTASGICGVALAYMFDTGIYLYCALFAYLGLQLLLSEQILRTLKDVKVLLRLAGLLVLPIIAGFVVLIAVQGASVFDPVFWKNAFEFSGLFLQGWGALPMYDGLKERQFFAFIMGFVIPVIYAFTMIVIAALCFRRQIDRKNMFAVVLCVYGLGLYHYFVNRSAVSSYYVVAMPLAAVIAFWLNAFFRTIPVESARISRLVLASVMTTALMSSYFFTYYPNALVQSEKTLDEEVRLYKQEFDLSADAKIIENFTFTDQRAAVISSFETALLIQAKRKPFFYYFPLVESSHMQLPSFRGTYLHTKDRFKKTMDQLEGEKPEYVFIESKLFRRKIPAQYYQVYQTLDVLVKYLDEHYEPAREGKYLVALKRKQK